MVERTVQSRAREMEMVLSAAAEMSFERLGKFSAVRLEEWCNREPSSRLRGFSAMLVPARVGSEGVLLRGGGMLEML